MDLTFKALADPTRRALLDRLYNHNGQTLSQLCHDLQMSRQAVSKHLSLLVEANLVVVLWRGRERFHFFNPVPLQQVSDQWIAKFGKAVVRALRDLERSLKQLEPAEK